MKEDLAENSLGDGDKSKHSTKKTKKVLYIVIALLLVYVWWINSQGISPKFDIERIASITSWSGGATSSDNFGFLQIPKYPDLEVKILELGVMNEAGTFIVNDPLTEESVVTIRVQITNLGKADSSTWKLEAILPTRDNYKYISPEQSSLKVGEVRSFLLSFDKLISNSNAKINVTIRHHGKETDIKNNLIRISTEVF